MTRNPHHSRTPHNLKIHVSPQSSQRAHVFLANYVKLAHHFSIERMRNGNSKFYSELRENRSIRQLPPQITQN